MWIILDIVPKRIDDAAWRDACVDVEALLRAWPGGSPIARDLDVYRSRARADVEPADDILLASAGLSARRSPPAYPVPTAAPRAHDSHARDGLVRVLGEAPCPAACATPLLAAAMLVETRFERRALAHGEIDRERADAARRWAEGVLGPDRPIALPVRVDAWRLVERLAADLAGPSLVHAVDRLHLAAREKKDAALLAAFGGAEVDACWLDKMRVAARLGAPRAIADTRALVASYLAATRDLARVLGLACLDPRGPRWPPDAFMEIIATLPALDGEASRPLDASSVERASSVVFGAGAERLVAIFRARAAAP